VKRCQRDDPNSQQKDQHQPVGGEGRGGRGVAGGKANKKANENADGACRRQAIPASPATASPATTSPATDATATKTNPAKLNSSFSSSQRKGESQEKR